MKDVSFYLIHNNSNDRILLRNRIQNLADKLSIDLIEIYKQKKNLKIKFTLKFKLKILRIYLLRIIYDIKHKKDFSVNFFYLILKSIFKLNKSIIKLFLKNKNHNIKAYRHIMIESFVTKKHIRAWEHFLKSKKEIMVIFEDDVICKNDTEKRLKDLFNKLKAFESKNIFIDLAGGYKAEDVIPTRKIKKLEDKFFIVEGIYTNTACSYLINRNLIKLLYEEYQKTKLNNSLPIDHLINKLGLKILKKPNLLSIHFHNPLFTHGSFAGNIKSWQIN
tara:strand:+ start:288 stop:1115 length:828 start_codon:yes stop_codon:yes gene_type:complete